jgi:hypothetical protein
LLRRFLHDHVDGRRQLIIQAFNTINLAALFALFLSVFSVLVLASLVPALFSLFLSVQLVNLT